MHLLTNPGEFTDSPNYFNFTTILGVFLLVVSIVFLGTAIASIWWTYQAHVKPGGSQRPVRNLLLVLALFTVAAVTGGAGGVLGAIEDVRYQESRVAYKAEVVRWMDDGYGIEFTADHVPAFVSGDSFTVEYHGEPTSVSVQLTPDGDLSLVDQKQSVLPAKD